MSDLWDAPQQPQQQQEPLSLRRAQGRGAAATTRPYQGRPGMGSSLSPEPQAQGRPLPSQRVGSYQSSTSSLGGRFDEPSPPPSAGSGGTAQERLKARLWGSGRSTSPAQSTTSSTNTSPAVTPAAGGMRSPFDRSGGQSGRAPYPDERSSGYSSGGGRQQNSYGMSANAGPGWEDPYAPPSSGYGGASQRPPPGGGNGRVGLPSGPRMR